MRTLECWARLGKKRARAYNLSMWKARGSSAFFFIDRDLSSRAGGLIPGLPNDVAFKILVLLPPSSIPALRRVNSLWRILLDSDRFYLECKRTCRSPSLFILRSHPTATAMEGLDIHLPWTDNFFKPLFTATNLDEQDDLVTLAVLHRVLILGPRVGVSAFDTRSRKWSTAPPMLYPRQRFVCGVIDARVVVVGSVESMPNCTPTEAYDPSTNSWIALPDIPRSVHAISLLPINGNLLLIATLGSARSASYCFYSFNPCTQSWSEEEALQNEMLPIPLSACSLVALSNGNFIRMTCMNPYLGLCSSIKIDLLPHKQSNAWIPLISMSHNGPMPFLVANENQCFLVTTTAQYGNEVLFKTPNPFYPNFKVVSVFCSFIRGACIVVP